MTTSICVIIRLMCQSYERYALKLTNESFRFPCSNFNFTGSNEVRVFCFCFYLFVCLFVCFFVFFCNFVLLQSTRQVLIINIPVMTLKLWHCSLLTESGRNRVILKHSSIYCHILHYKFQQAIQVSLLLVLLFKNQKH